MLISKLQCILGRRRRGSGGFDLFDKIASATGGQIIHTSSSSLGSILGSFVKVT